MENMLTLMSIFAGFSLLVLLSLYLLSAGLFVSRALKTKRKGN